ncbi:MAG: zinc ribbon domain-containing protein [Bacteroidales bacterium]|nr:zinc ribbon domain-containing protein [Bacteroidales bacterium]
MTKICKKCKAENRDEARFCGTCGTSLEDYSNTFTLDKFKDIDLIPISQFNVEKSVKKDEIKIRVFQILFIVASIIVGLYWYNGKPSEPKEPKYKEYPDRENYSSDYSYDRAIKEYERYEEALQTYPKRQENYETLYLPSWKKKGFYGTIIIIVVILIGVYIDKRISISIIESEYKTQVNLIKTALKDVDYIEKSTIDSMYRRFIHTRKMGLLNFRDTNHLKVIPAEYDMIIKYGNFFETINQHYYGMVRKSDFKTILNCEWDKIEKTDKYFVCYRGDGKVYFDFEGKKLQ